MDVLIIGASPHENQDLFLVAEHELAKKGYNVHNPLKFQTPGLRETHHLRQYLNYLAQVKAVCFLPNWHEAPYAELLQRVAKGTELHIEKLEAQGVA